MYDLRSELIVSPTLNRRGDVVARTSSFCRRRWGEEIAEPEKSRVFSLFEALSASFLIVFWSRTAALALKTAFKRGRDGLWWKHRPLGLFI